MPETSFRLPGAAREQPYPDGSGGWTNVNNVLSADASYASCFLPDGSTYFLTGGETSAGHILPSAILLNNFNFAAELPANATVTGIAVKSVLYSSYSESGLNINYYVQFCNFPDSVINIYDDYLLFEQKPRGAAKDDTGVYTIGGAGDVWMPNPNITIDGMFLYSTDSNIYGYEVQTSEQMPGYYSLDFGSGVNLFIQPTTQDITPSSFDALGCITDFAAVLANGGTITLSYPGSLFPDVTFVAQSGPATPGTATFQCSTSNDDAMRSLADQIGSHAVTAGYLTVSFYRDIVFYMQSVDAGSQANAITISTNVPSYVVFYNDGQFYGGADVDPDISTMNNITAAPLVKDATSGAIIGRASPITTTLEVTNSLTRFTLKHSVPASVFRDPNFGVLFFYNWVDSETGDPEVYPEISDNEQRLRYAEVSLTYTAPTGHGLMTLGVGR